MNAICATCGCDLTVIDEDYDGRDIMMPLISVSVLPCSTCLSRVASEAKEEGESHE
jgi:hypothetical protein